MLINIADIDKNCGVLGPGRRFIIWVQGCVFSCKGCYNKSFQALKENKLMDTSEIIQMIEKEKENINGVTFLGGEPFLQAKQLGLIAEEVKKMGLSLLCYTGFSYSQEIRKNKNIDNLLKYIDVLIDGAYIEEKRELKKYRGSTNQNIIFLTDLYTEKDFNVDNSYEIDIVDNKVKIKGFYK